MCMSDAHKPNIGPRAPTTACARPCALTCSTPPGLVPLTSTHAALLSLSFPFPASSSASSLPTRSIFADAYCRTWSRILKLYASGSRISKAAASPFSGSVGLGYLSRCGRNCSKMFTKSWRINRGWVRGWLGKKKERTV